MYINKKEFNKIKQTTQKKLNKQEEVIIHEWSMFVIKIGVVLSILFILNKL